MVYKPSELTPLTALALAEFAIQAGIPKGVFNIVQACPHNVLPFLHIKFSGANC